MRIFLVAATAALLAGCGAASTANNSSDNAATVNETLPAEAPVDAVPGSLNNVTEPTGNESAAAGGGANGSRQEMWLECTVEAGARLPAGTDVAALCNCAVDRVIAGGQRNAAIRQCAAEQNVQLPGN